MARKRETLRLLQTINNAMVVLQQAAKEKPVKLKKEIEDEAKSIISRFYLEGPHQGSLYSAYRVEIENIIDVSVDYDASYMSEFSHHQDNEIIYNNVFVMGYHGGSWGKGLENDTPWWRTPTPYYTHWYKPASQSFSPYQEINRMVDKKISKYDKEWNDLLYKKVLNPIKRSVSGYLRKG